MENLSLQQVMNDMVQGEGAVTAHLPSHASHKTPKKLTELDAFICIDPLLKHLHQQYLEAKRDRKALAQAHGKDDPMVEVAMDMEDSAWCAMQTRYLELRTNRKLMTLAQALMRDSEYAQTRAVEEKEKEKALKVFYYFQTLEKMREMNRPSRVFEIWLILIFLKLDPVSALKRRNEQKLVA